MSVIALRALNESVNFDHELLNGLFQKLPEREAEKILLQTLENISITLSAIHESYFSEEREGLVHALCALRNFQIALALQNWLGWLRTLSWFMRLEIIRH